MITRTPPGLTHRGLSTIQEKHTHAPRELHTMTKTHKRPGRKIGGVIRYKCGCCHKWTLHYNHKRDCYVCEFCQKGFSTDIVAKHNRCGAEELEQAQVDKQP